MSDAQLPGYELSAESRFSAAHTLPGVDMCDRLHGHNWRVRVTVHVAEDRLDHLGMGIDFRVLENIARQAVADFEHRHLNELPDFVDHPPTAEYIAKLVSRRAQSQLDQRAPHASVSRVEIWEMPEYRVVYRP